MQAATAVLGKNAMKLYLGALHLANSTPGFYDKKGAGPGDHATNNFMKALRKGAEGALGRDYSEKSVCKTTKHAFDFYIPEERTVIEVALSLRNSGSEFERDIFKCLIAREDGALIDFLFFISKPGAMARHEAAGSKRIMKLVKQQFGLEVIIFELMPNTSVEELLKRAGAIKRGVPE